MMTMMQVKMVCDSVANTPDGDTTVTLSGVRGTDPASENGKWQAYVPSASITVKSGKPAAANFVTGAEYLVDFRRQATGDA